MTPRDTSRRPTPEPPAPVPPAQMTSVQMPSMNERDEAMWQRQEAARLGLGGDAADRLIAQALAQPLPVGLPTDFAARLAREVAHQVASEVALRRAPSPAFEWTLAGLAVALLSLAAGVVLHLDPELATGATTALAAPAGNGWLLWLAVALAAAAIRPSPLRPPRYP